jgi:acetyl esterase
MRPMRRPGFKSESPTLQAPPLPERLRRRAGALVFDNLYLALATGARLHPLARPARHGVEVLRNVPYRPSGDPAHWLDVYRPTGGTGPYPVVLYVHGGSFRILSKDTHWMMALGFARRGYLVLNINYRLAPRHPFPAAVEDACAALVWAMEHAADYGGDPRRLVLAGESAGANLATALAVAASYRRPEGYARAVWEAEVRPRAVVAACGILQVSDARRFARRKLLPGWLYDRLVEPSEAYLGGLVDPHPERELADPLLVLERGERPERPLPPFFAPVGTRDPLLDDTRRLKAALDRLGTRCEARFYPGDVHAFHAMVFLPSARRCWRELYGFLDEHVPAEE